MFIQIILCGGFSGSLKTQYSFFPFLYSYYIVSNLASISHEKTVGHTYPTVFQAA
ncbi:hypothetical protein MIS45_10395 [Wielerella bovis]|uniref:hypothetical protein n=1 Tax=Wielerella bovis TaxID=2917790 RepID=UPI002019FC27|nr:hypothetical protein [Wielerella bovis]ULJ60214.1 hypothetical protein MIS44_11295 [Wielerella bovis]ULJ69142.1 hypothetical protein MIS45_10395 [Wielerella bovis]